jgi:hypothetical protein
MSHIVLNIEEIGLTRALISVPIMCISGDGQRIRWIFILANCIQPSVMPYTYNNETA